MAVRLKARQKVSASQGIEGVPIKRMTMHGGKTFPASHIPIEKQGPAPSSLLVESTGTPVASGFCRQPRDYCPQAEHRYIGIDSINRLLGN